jgi:hypothetical protein
MSVYMPLARYLIAALQHPETIAPQLLRRCGVEGRQPFWSEVMKRLICIVLAAASLSACVVLPVGHGRGYGHGHRHYSAPPVMVVPPAPGPGYQRGYQREHRGW